MKKQKYAHSVLYQ